MSFAFNIVLLAITTTLSLAGCSNKEKEMLNRKSDGTDTFKYVPSQRALKGSAADSSGTAPKSATPSRTPAKDKVQADKPNDGIPPSAQAKPSTRRGDLSDFKYVPSERVLKQMGQR